jgi:pyrroline-5-carboxylate reductase
MNIVFLGGGNLTTALLAGLRETGEQRPVFVHDRNPGKLRALARRFGAVPLPHLPRAVAQADLLLIAVRPASLHDLLAAIPAPAHSQIAVSMAAGVPLRHLRARLGARVHWARAMPSPVCRGGRGLTALAFDRALTARQRKIVRRFFAQFGPALVVPEREFDIFSAVYSPSQGYYALDALDAAARKLGLGSRIARIAAAHALADAVDEWRESGTSLQELIREAATPGGIAAAVMAVKERAGYRAMVERSLRAGVERARQMRARR